MSRRRCAACRLGSCGPRRWLVTPSWRRTGTRKRGPTAARVATDARVTRSKRSARGAVAVVTHREVDVGAGLAAGVRAIGLRAIHRTALTAHLIPAGARYCRPALAAPRAAGARGADHETVGVCRALGRSLGHRSRAAHHESEMQECHRAHHHMMSQIFEGDSVKPPRALGGSDLHGCAGPDLHDGRAPSRCRRRSADAPRRASRLESMLQPISVVAPRPLRPMSKVSTAKGLRDGPSPSIESRARHRRALRAGPSRCGRPDARTLHASRAGAPIVGVGPVCPSYVTRGRYPLCRFS